MIIEIREVDHLKVVINMFLKKFPKARNQMLIMVDGNGNNNQQ